MLPGQRSAKTDLKVITKRPQNESDHKATTKWPQSDPKVTPKWSQSDPKVTPKWPQREPIAMAMWLFL